jgi:hypothetical protein
MVLFMGTSLHERIFRAQAGIRRSRLGLGAKAFWENLRVRRRPRPKGETWAATP